MPFDRLLTTAAALLAISLPQMAAAQTASGASAAAPPAAGLPAAPAAAPSALAAPVTPAGDLVESLRHNGHFTVLIKALDATNLTNLLKTRPGLTLFAPTDAAFAKLPAGQLDSLMANKPALQKLLTHHLINAVVNSSKITGKKGPVTTVAGDPMELDGSEPVLKADNATIIQADVHATNGILQIVDNVLTPAPAATAANTTPVAVSTATASR